MNGVCKIGPTGKTPVCSCYTNVAEGITYYGEYCQFKTFLASTTTRKPTDTSLIVSIVLPIIAFITLVVLVIVSVYFCYKRLVSINLILKINYVT